jgi:hypothetical protein
LDIALVRADEIVRLRPVFEDSAGKTRDASRDNVDLDRVRRSRRGRGAKFPAARDSLRGPEKLREIGEAHWSLRKFPHGPPALDRLFDGDIAIRARRRELNHCG